MPLFMHTLFHIHDFEMAAKQKCKSEQRKIVKYERGSNI